MVNSGPFDDWKDPQQSVCYSDPHSSCHVYVKKTQIRGELRSKVDILKKEYPTLKRS